MRFLAGSAGEKGDRGTPGAGQRGQRGPPGMFDANIAFRKNLFFLLWYRTPNQDKDCGSPHYFAQALSELISLLIPV